MPLLRVAVPELCEGDQPLAAAAAHYLVRVHRLRPGARFLAFDPRAATESEATLLDERPARARFEALRPASLRPHRAVTLLQALGKGDKPEQVVEAATAMGVTRLGFVDSERSVKKLDAARAETQRERWRRVAVDVARQSGRGDVPEIEGPFPLREALAAVQAERRLLLAPGGARRFVELAAGADPITLLIGAEGGFSDVEVAAAEGAGFVVVSVWDTVLRTELACKGALGALFAVTTS